jgi:hypothetical protein
MEDVQKAMAAAPTSVSWTLRRKKVKKNASQRRFRPDRTEIE